MSEPIVSVVLATHQGGKYLEAAVSSVLAQTFKDFELILIDDASTDGSVAPFANHADPRLRVVQNEVNIGQTRSLNKGIASARGRYIARMDSDDICLPDRLALQVGAMDRHSDSAVIGGQALMIDAAENTLGQTRMPCAPQSVRAFGFLQNPFIHPTVMLRRETLSHCGLEYDPAFAVQDFDLWTRLLERFEGRNIEDVVLWYRVHDGSMTHRNRERNFVECGRIIARSFANTGLGAHHDAKMVSDLLRYFFQDRHEARKAGVNRVWLAQDYLGLMRQLDKVVPYTREMRCIAIERLILSGIWPEGAEELAARAALFARITALWPLETAIVLGRLNAKAAGAISRRLKRDTNKIRWAKADD